MYCDTIACRRPELPEGADTLLPSLHDLTSFAAMDKDFVPDSNECPTIRAVIEANATTLRALALTGDVWAQWPPTPSFANLAELDLVCIESSSELGDIFAHCTRLRSFTLIYAEIDVIPVLVAHPRALPNLDSFKIWAVDYTGDDVAVLARFLQSKKRLRRMDVMVRTDAQWLVADNLLLLTPVLEILPKLPELQVVGLSVRVASLEKEHLQELDVHLPDSLTALLIWTNITSSNVPANDWIELVRWATSTFRSSRQCAHGTRSCLVVQQP